MIVAAIMILPITAKTENAYTPQKGSKTRKAILDGLRAELKKMSGANVVFVVDHLKTKGRWAWVEAQPRSRDGQSQFENISALMRQSADGRWCTVLIPSYECASADNPENACRQADRKLLHNLTSDPMNVPVEIFPKSFGK
jgi:RNA:NAD 2'-phosphotransferase (TPT1/KptA family)